MNNYEQLDERMKQQAIEDVNTKSTVIQIDQTYKFHENMFESDVYLRNGTPLKKFMNQQNNIQAVKIQLKIINNANINCSINNSLSSLIGSNTTFEKCKCSNPQNISNTFKLAKIDRKKLSFQSFQQNITEPEDLVIQQVFPLIDNQKKISKEDKYSQQILKIVYKTKWNIQRYLNTFKQQKKTKVSTLDRFKYFNIEEKITQDIILSIIELKQQKSLQFQNKLQIFSQKKKNSKPEKYYFPNQSRISNLALETDIVKFQNQNSLIIKQLKNQLSKKDEIIKLLMKQIDHLGLQLDRLKYQCEHLHRLNEQKYFKISDLKKQVQQQQQFIQEQVSVIEELQQSVLINSESFIEGNTIIEHHNRNIISSQEIMVERNIVETQNMNLFERGKLAAWKQLLDEIECQIGVISQSKQFHEIENCEINWEIQYDQLVLQNEKQILINNLSIDSDKYQDKARRNNIQIEDNILNQTQNILNNYRLHQIDDGIEQIDITFKHLLQVATQTDINESEFKQNQSYYETPQNQYDPSLIDEEISLIECTKKKIHPNHPFLELSPKQNFDAPHSDYFETSVEEFSFLSTNPGKYLQTIETLTQQLSDAYETINSMKKKLSLFEFDNHKFIKSNHQPNHRKKLKQTETEDPSNESYYQENQNLKHPDSKNHDQNSMIKKLGLKFSFWK